MIVAVLPRAALWLICRRIDKAALRHLQQALQCIPRGLLQLSMEHKAYLLLSAAGCGWPAHGPARIPAGTGCLLPV